MIKYALVCDKGHDFESWFARCEVRASLRAPARS